MIKRQKEWENPDTKTNFIKSLHEEYLKKKKKYMIDRTRNRVRCVIPF